jgi:hypothetical protein
MISARRADLRWGDSDVAPEHVGEVAVAGVAELQGQFREIGVVIAETLDGHLDAQGVPVTRQRLTGAAAKGAAEPPRRAVHRARQIADGDVALEIAGNRLLRLLHERARLVHVGLDAPGSAKVSPGNKTRRPEVCTGLDAGIVA